MEAVSSPPDQADRELVVYDFGQSAGVGEEATVLYREAAVRIATDINSQLREVVPGFVVESDGLIDGGSLLAEDREYNIAPLLSLISHCGFLAVEERLGLAVVGGALGGATKGEIESRSLTSIETRVLDLVMSAVVETAGRTLLIEDVSIDRTSDAFDTPDEDDSAHHIGFRFTMSGPRSSGGFVLAFEADALHRFSEMVDRRLSGRRGLKEASEPSPEVVRALNPVPVELSVGVGRATLTAREVVELRQGDVIRTRVPVDGDLVASAGDIDLFGVRLAQRGARLVAEIQSTINDPRQTLGRSDRKDRR